MKKAITVTIAVTLYSDKDLRDITGAITRGIYVRLDDARVAQPKNVKIEVKDIQIVNH